MAQHIVAVATWHWYVWMDHYHQIVFGPFMSLHYTSSNRIHCKQVKFEVCWGQLSSLPSLAQVLTAGLHDLLVYPLHVHKQCNVHVSSNTGPQQCAVAGL